MHQMQAQSRSYTDKRRNRLPFRSLRGRPVQTSRFSGSQADPGVGIALETPYFKNVRESAMGYPSQSASLMDEDEVVPCFGVSLQFALTDRLPVVSVSGGIEALAWDSRRRSFSPPECT